LQSAVEHLDEPSKRGRIADADTPGDHEPAGIKY
jgi:hypothetical protein